MGRGVARGGTGGFEPPRSSADQLTLFKPGADNAPQITASPSNSKSYLHLWTQIVERGSSGGGTPVKWPTLAWQKSTCSRLSHQTWGIIS